MKRAINILFWVLVISGIITALLFMQNKHKQGSCLGFNVSITDDRQDLLIDEEAIRQTVLLATDSLKGKAIGDIDLRQIHEVLNTIPWVHHARIQADISGFVNVKISLRRAIVRVDNANGLSYYIDTEGWLLPVNPGYPSRVMIANGRINDGLSSLEGKKLHISDLDRRPVISEIYNIANYIDSSPFLKRMISQLYRDGRGEYELTPIVGSYCIKFGKEENRESKFEKLETFYREGAGKAGWIDYRSIDLRYKNQIICSKK